MRWFDGHAPRALDEATVRPAAGGSEDSLIEGEAATLGYWSNRPVVVLVKRITVDWGCPQRILAVKKGTFNQNCLLILAKPR